MAGWFRNWFWNQWNDISGNVKFWILAKVLGGGGVVSFLAFLWGTLKGMPHADTLMYASLWLVSAVLFLVSERRIISLTTRLPLGVAGSPDVIALTQEEQNLSVDILEAHLGWQPMRGNEELYETRKLWLLVKLRVAPLKQELSRVTQWAVSFSEYEGFVFGPTIEEIPAGLQYVSTGEHGIKDIPRVPTPDLCKGTGPIAKGDCRDGFLLISLYADYEHKCFRYHLQVAATDTFNHTSTGFKTPGSWLHPTAFSINEPIRALAPVVPWN